MKRYKAIFMKVGSAVIEAESEKAALELARRLPDEKILWVSEPADSKTVERIVLVEDEE